MSRSLTWFAIVVLAIAVQHRVNAVCAEPEPALESADSSPADKALDALAERSAALERGYRQAMAQARSPEERLDIYRRLAPGNAMLDDYFAFERDHRGEPAAIAVLYRLMAAAMSVGDSELPVSKARVKAIEVARTHYAEHSDLDALLNSFEAGAWTPEAEPLLRRAMDSPHAHVRACATVRLASWLWHRISLVQSSQSFAELADDSADDNTRNESLQIIADQIGPLDVDESRREALAVLDHLTADEAAVDEAIWQTGREQRLRLTRADAKQLKIAHPVTYGKRAESLRFEIENLALGSTVPDIEGTDADDGFFKLSDYRGKVVVLMFSASWCGPCLAMYPDNRQLVEKHRGQPFAFLSVMGDDDREGLREKVREGEITWRAWTDGMNGPISTRWNVRSWPTIYVLDHRGGIAYRGLRGPSLERAVARLLAARDRDPAAGKTAGLDPFEESPLLEQGKAMRRKLGRAVQDRRIAAGSRHADAVAFTPDGKLLVTAGFDSDAGVDPAVAWGAGQARGVLQLWNLDLGKQVATFEGDAGAFFGVAMSPDGKSVATAGRVYNQPKTGEVKLWDLDARREVATLDGHAGWVLSVAFSPDGRLLATGGFDKTPRIWDVASTQLFAQLPVQDGAVEEVEFSPDGATLATATRKGVVALWEVETWNKKEEFSKPDYFLLDLAFSPDGNWLATAGAAGKAEQHGLVLLKKLGTDDPCSEIPVSGGLMSSLAFSPDSKLLATLTMPSGRATTGGVRVFRVGDQSEFAIIRRPQSSSLDQIIFLPRGRTIAVNDHLGYVSLWKLADEQADQGSDGEAGSVSEANRTPAITAKQTAP